MALPVLRLLVEIFGKYWEGIRNCEFWIEEKRFDKKEAGALKIKKNQVPVDIELKILDYIEEPVLCYLYYSHKQLRPHLKEV